MQEISTWSLLRGAIWWLWNPPLSLAYVHFQLFRLCSVFLYSYSSGYDRMCFNADFLYDIVLAGFRVIVCDIKGDVACWQSPQWYEFLCQLCSIPARWGKPGFYWLSCAVVTGVSMSQWSTLFVRVDGIVITNIRYYQGFGACLPADGRALTPVVLWHFNTVAQWLLFIGVWSPKYCMFNTDAEKIRDPFQGPFSGILNLLSICV